VKTLENQILIPSSAIQHNGSTDFVYVIEPNGDQNGKPTYKAVMQNVKSGISDKGNTAVTGINAGTIVANSSFEKLTNNAVVYQSKVALPTSGTTEDSAP
jgi:multidrug efflux system membrane fusion protein